MNIVFWLIVVIALVLIWFCLSFAFKGIGGVGMTRRKKSPTKRRKI